MKWEAMAGPMKVGRIARLAMYAMYATAGVFAWWNSLTTLHQAGLEFWSIKIWAIFLFLGGIGGMITALTDHWMFEYCGLVLLTTVFFTLGLSSALTAAASPARISVAALFFAFALSCYVRWSVINRFARLSAARKGD